MYPELKLHEKSKTLKSMTLVKALGLLGAGVGILGVGSLGAWVGSYWFEVRTCRKWGIEFEDDSWFLWLRGGSRGGEWGGVDGGLGEGGEGEYGDVVVSTLGTESQIQMADNTLKPEEM
jgi:hypothetical protein